MSIPMALPDATLGIPGTVTETALTFIGPLDFDEWAEKLTLLGRIGGCVNWWIADAINYGEDHFGEAFAQGLIRLSDLYAPQTLLNLAAVGRAFHPVHRRGLPATFSHHAALAGIKEAVIREAWLDKIERGDVLPNGERKPWSVSRLRAEVKMAMATPEVQAGRVHPSCPTCTCEPRATAP